MTQAVIRAQVTFTGEAHGDDVGGYIRQVKVISIHLVPPLVLTDFLTNTLDHILMLKVEPEKPHKPVYNINKVLRTKKGFNLKILMVLRAPMSPKALVFSAELAPPSITFSHQGSPSSQSGSPSFQPGLWRKTWR
jgi:hypothetical protein